MRLLKALGCIALFLSLTGCVDIITAVTGLPDAENSLVTTDGRLIVSTYNGLYEITRPGSLYQKNELFRSDEDSIYDPASKTAVHLGNGDFLGLAEFGGTVYAAFHGCNFKSYILAFNLESGERHIAHRLKKATMPNGIDFDQAGRLYVADQMSLSLKIGRILRLAIDPALKRTKSDADETVWIDRGIGLPNGVLFHNHTLFITDLGSVKKIPVLSSGAPGTVKTIHTRALTVLDDLDVYGDNLVVADFTKGTVFELSPSGRLLQELPAGSIAGPSSVAMGHKTDIFPADAVITTSKGVLFDRWSAIGNRLVYFIMP